MSITAFTPREIEVIETVASRLGADVYAVANIAYCGICLGSIDKINLTSVTAAYRSATRRYD